MYKYFGIFCNPNIRNLVYFYIKMREIPFFIDDAHFPVLTDHRVSVLKFIGSFIGWFDDHLPSIIFESYKFFGDFLAIFSDGFYFPYHFRHPSREFECFFWFQCAIYHLVDPMTF